MSGPEPNEPSPPPSTIVDPAALMRVLGVLEKLNASNDLHVVLGLIIDSMRDCLHAERASVFQFDAKAQELFITTAHGVTNIRFPITRGIAGEAGRTRQIINVKDAWEDPRFNPEFDKKTGFRTRGMLTIPLISADGTLEGVAQALNKNPKLGAHFDASDEVLAKALASQAAIALRRATLIEAEIRKKKIEGDLALAKTIQIAALPKSIPAIAGYTIAAQTIPAEETGGDTFDVINLADLPRVPADEGHVRAMRDGLVFMLADATGHGIGPAISVTQARSMLRMGARLGGDLSRVVAHLNAQLCEDLPSGRFITAFIGVLDPVAHTITYESPGQAPLLIVRADGSFEEFNANAMPMGIDAEMLPDVVEPFVLRPGDVFLLASDGYIEAMDPDNGQFGTEPTVNAIREKLGGTAEEMLANLNQRVTEFARGRPFGDDQTAIIIKRMV
ncbi:MAG: PP2C family protein-serine/threonine phosphatase [Phycisphaerales bacterium]